MSDELRKEFEEKEEYVALLYDNPKTLFKTFHDKYVLWLESQLLTARSRVKALEDESARMKASVVFKPKTCRWTPFEGSKGDQRYMSECGHQFTGIYPGIKCSCGLPVVEVKDGEG